MTTRRDFLESLALGAGAGAIVSLYPTIAAAQPSEREAVIRRLQADLERHASFGDKFSGGPGDLATADWIAGRLRRAGYRVEESSFDAPFFVKRAARLVSGSTSADVVPQAPVVPTGASGITAMLALVDAAGTIAPEANQTALRQALGGVDGGGAVGDVAGRIAVVVAPFARHAALFADRGLGRTVTQVARKGAAAIVIVTTGPSGEAVALNAPEEPFVSIPTVVLAPKRSAEFIAAARAGAMATLTLDGTATHRPSRNLVARIERGKRWIALSTPRSGWYGCVAERGTGTAVFLELADWLSKNFPTHSVFAMNTGGHEYFFAGSHRVIGQAPPPADTAVWAHIGATLAARDAVERDGRWVMLDTVDPQRNLMASGAMRDLAASAFRGLPGLETAAPIQEQAGELSTFTDRGYANAFAVLGVHRWFHTPDDTLACVDARLLEPVLRAHETAIESAVGRDA
jgi:hypothetical protein